KLDQCWEKHTGVDYSDHVYVEGIGTFNNIPDAPLGKGLGISFAGVKEKADKGLIEILYRITQKNIKKKKIKFIYLDAFGFSRGAAAARYFVYHALKKKSSTIEDVLKDRGYTIEEPPKVKFVGLFDTVATYGIFTENHGIINGDDVSQLKLDSIKEAEYTLQLAANDEHRNKFSLTNINSVSSSKGCEIFLPGVHSDIGGGYVDGANEDGLVLMKFGHMVGYLTPHEIDVLVCERQRLIEEGWYKENEIKVIYNGRYANMSRSGHVVVYKSNIRNTYNRIPLHIMARFAQKKGKVQLLNYVLRKYINKLKDTEYNKLRKFKMEIDKNVPKPGATNIHHISKNLKRETLKELKHDFFHFSANYNALPNHPRFSNGGPEYGKRKRGILVG
ncbi:MAG: DUF2235 domain-containing protein, partial [Chitinispirillia bacterium]